MTFIISITGGVVLVVIALGGFLHQLRWPKGESSYPSSREQGVGREVMLRIESPAEGQEVPMRYLVRGRVYDPQVSVCVMVRPLRTGDWWVQDRPSISGDGKWQVMAFFGTTTLGIGEKFEVAAVAIPPARCHPGQTLPDLPPGAERSNIVTVIRTP